jgi:hypothetical protein
MKALKLIAIVAALGSAGMAEARGQSVAQIKQAIIRQSIANYSGSCPCPYSVMRNGRSCGGRSAYSRPGGESPICYASDVTDAEVRAWRQR